MKRRGVSTIIASVFIILFTVASVSIVWVAVLPLIEQVSFVEDPRVQVKVEPGEYTAYDRNNDLLSVRVMRGADEANIVALKFIIDDNGNSVSHKIFDVLNSNSGKVYTFSTVGISSVDSVGVVPIYDVSGKEIESEISNTNSKLLEKVLTPVPGAVFGYEATSVYEGVTLFLPFDGDFLDYSAYGSTVNIRDGSPIITSEIDFDGSSSLQVVHVDNVNYTKSDDYTVSVWINARNVPSSVGTIVEKWDNSGSYPFVMRQSISNGIGCAVYNGTQGPGNPSTGPFSINFANDGWHHVACRFDHSNSEISIWVDGRLEDSYVYSNLKGLIYNDDNIYIGSRDGNFHYDGQLDDLIIFNNSLSSKQIKRLYQIGRSE